VNRLVGDLPPPAPSAALIAPATEGAVDCVAIVADRRLSVAALVALLVRDGTYRLVQQAHGRADITHLLHAFEPEVLVVESVAYGSPGWLDLASWAESTLLLLDPEDHPGLVARAARAGVQGYLSRAASGDALAGAIDTLGRLGTYVDPGLSAYIGLALAEQKTSAERGSAGLSPRERAILVGIASGRSSKEIAREYAITAKTVCNHVTNIYHKLNLRHRGELVLYAAQAGLTTLEPGRWSANVESAAGAAV
jgi:DNA-binding NarL/FixJ family response regulator